MTVDFRTAFISYIKHTLKEEDLWGVMNVETGDTLSTFETEQDAKDFVSEIQQQLVQDDLSPGELKVFKYDDNSYQKYIILFSAFAESGTISLTFEFS